jgi:hypothetical protein
MWSPETEQEEGDEGESLKEITLPGGRRVYVGATYRPMLMEWDWDYDVALAQPVRMERGRKRTMYEDELGWFYRRRSDEGAPTLDRPATRAMFGHLPGFLTLLRYSQAQREFALVELGLNLPLPTEVLSAGLSYALLSYFEWFYGASRWEFAPDPSGLTPGTLTTTEAREEYATLGKWAGKEYTGHWVRSRSSPTGLAPETYKSRLMREVRSIWLQAAQHDNFGEISMKEIEASLRAGERPVFLLVRQICSLIETYETPNL